MNEGKALDWGICGVGVMPFDATMKQIMDAQDCLYTLVLKAPRRQLGTPGHRVHRRVPVRPRRPGRGHREDGRPGHPDRVAHRHRRRLQLPPGHRRVRRREPCRGSGSGPGAVPGTTFGLITEALVRRRDRGVPPFTIMSCDNIQGNGARRPEGVHHLRPAPRKGLGRRRPRRLGAAERAVPELHGRPDHPGDHRPGPGRRRRTVRHHRRLAGGVRTVHPMGAGRPLRHRPAAASRTSGCNSSTTSNPTS